MNDFDVIGTPNVSGGKNENVPQNLKNKKSNKPQVTTRLGWILISPSSLMESSNLHNMYHKNNYCAAFMTISALQTEIK